jgi:acetyl/propionyl-CoA carboxylase alpha subunit
LKVKENKPRLENMGTFPFKSLIEEKRGKIQMDQRPPVLIANRGEIAIRIAKTCKVLGFPTVAVYSDADAFSEHVKVCDSAYWIGSSEPKESYLNIERMLVAARAAGAKFVHPGYGFLSERPHFVEACEKAGLIFIGPTADSMRTMGDKIAARKTVESVGMPSVPGSEGVITSLVEAKKVAKEIGYPVLLKATAGGGGKGMRRVDTEREIESAFGGATREAEGAFGNGALYIEKFILKPHHVEVQVFGDGKGNAIHLGERECSIQRRHQKIWEESPSPLLNRFPETRAKMTEAAVKAAKHIRYRGAGTFEFIVDEKGSFYFLEMNTRLQVEHPVTEWVTGVDLVAWQLLLAAGEFKLPAQAPERKGCSIEVRLYAEDPHRFLPSPGEVGLLHGPTGPYVRWDSSMGLKGNVSIHYDPMIAKLSVWAETRAQALSRLKLAMNELRVERPRNANGEVKGSLQTNLPFLKRLVENDAVLRGDTPTDLIEIHPELTLKKEEKLSKEAAIALSLFQLIEESEEQSEGQTFHPESYWRFTARRNGGPPMKLNVSSHLRVKGIEGKVGEWKLEWLSAPRGPRGSAQVKLESGERVEVSWERDEQGLWISLPSGVHGFEIRKHRNDEASFSYEVLEREGDLHWEGAGFLRSGEAVSTGAGASKKRDLKVKAQMPGKIVRVMVKEGDQVEKGASLIVMEAMKMENEIIAPADGKIKKISVEEGQPIETGTELVVLAGE